MAFSLSSVSEENPVTESELSFNSNSSIDGNFSDPGSTTIRLVSKSNTNSEVWTYFGFVPDEAGNATNMDVPKCRLCLNNVPAKWANTSNLFYHLKKNHPVEYSQVKSKDTRLPPRRRGIATSTGRQQTLSQCVEQTKKYSRTSREHEKMTKAVTECIAADILPIYSVDKAGFRKLVSILNPRYDLPHREHFSRLAIPSLYEETKQGLLSQLQKECCYFSLTTDLWSSTSLQPYLSCTIHYIDSEWELHSHCLQAQYTPEDHTGENLKDALTSALVDWRLDSSKLVAITTDSASNIISACRQLTWQRLSCFGHNLDLAVNKGINDGRVDRVVRLCRRVVAAFSTSWKRQRELKSIQQQRKLPQKKLVADVVTRWGSTAAMLERLIEQMEAVRTVLGQDRKVSHLVPSWQDCDVINAVFAAIEPLQEITDILSGEQQVTCSAIKPLLEDVILNKIVVECDDDVPLTREIKQRISDDLRSRYSSSELNLLLNKCTFLDPRFKHKYKDADECVELIIAEISSTTVQPEGDTTNTSEEPTNPPAKKGKFSSLFGTSFPNIHGQSAGISSKERAIREVNLYLDYPPLCIDESPLCWWKIEAARLPLLSIAARKYLSVCATSVASERVFSVGGNIVTSRRSVLKPQKVNQLIFLAKNIN